LNGRATAFSLIIVSLIIVSLIMVYAPYSLCYPPTHPPTHTQQPAQGFMTALIHELTSKRQLQKKIDLIFRLMLV
jgi:hypothetical protein